MARRLEEKVIAELDRFSKDVFTRNAEEYFRRPEIQRECWSIVARIMGGIWEGTENYKPKTVYSGAVEELRARGGDIAAEIGGKIVYAKVRFNGGTVSKWVRKKAQEMQEGYVKKILGELPSEVMEKLLVGTPNRENFVSATRKNYASKEKVTAQRLDDKLSGVMYRVLMDAFERYLVDYIGRSFKKNT